MLRILKKIFFKLSFFIVVINVIGQNPISNNLLNISDLPDTVFYDLIESDDHAIWLSARKGLYKYNGNNYTKIVNENQIGGSVFGLKKDSQGTIWCNNIYGQIFYIENNVLKLFYNASNFTNGQLAYFSIKKNVIELYTVSGVYQIDKNTKNITEIYNGVVLSASSNKKSHYFFSSQNQNKKIIYNIYESNQTLKNILQLEIESYVGLPRFYAFNNLAILSFQVEGLNQFYSIQHEKDVLKLNTPKLIEDITIYNIKKINNVYWFLTTEGVYVYQLLNINKFVFIEHIFKNESVTDVEVDFNKNYWLTTLDNGIIVSPNLNIRSISLSNSKDKITAVCKLNTNNFLVGTNNGKLHFYNKGVYKKTIQLNSKKVVGNLFFDSEKNKIIVSINASQSYIVNLNDYSVENKKNKYSVAKKILKIGEKQLFYGNYKEAIIYKNPYTSDSLKLVASKRVKTALNINNILYISFLDGLFRYNLFNETLEEVNYNNQSIHVNEITQTKSNIWLATKNYGLLYYKDGEFIRSSVKFPKNISAIESDGKYLWLVTDNAIYKYNEETEVLKLLSEQDGINQSINNILVLKDNLVLFMPNQFYILPKNNKLFKNYKTAQVSIDNILINDRDTLVNYEYKLPYYLNKIRIEFNSNGFQSNKNILYQYRLNKISEKWNSIPIGMHYVEFNSLSSGKYNFELKATNINGTNSVAISPILFIIKKPFWQWYWFYILILAISLSLLYMYFKKRLKDKENQRLTEISKIIAENRIANLRLENLRSQMNPHFIFNALNSIQDYIVSNHKDLASSYLVKFSRLIRMYLDYSQENEITLSEELHALKLYLELERVRFEEEFNYTVNVDQAINTEIVKVPSLFIQPYVENALKHGLLHKKEDKILSIAVNFIDQNKKIQIRIKDNGIGRKASKEINQSSKRHQPFATKANQERVSLYKNKLNRDIAIKIEDLYSNNIATGTLVIITMSVKK
ncbi:histidine kinase [Lutibacter sp. TH_r2]|uniref:sensor histidine kinase n=1 Tax=Lutibacter sp. TH_r2 TaxID=3082083 RepID=UPI00295596B4|nr:histidine kinase [Lutibacter sp. TH_r2]MDV7187894.1 histidine kinase [Lutibacter sp. TH_r2]